MDRTTYWLGAVLLGVLLGCKGDPVCTPGTESGEPQSPGSYDEKNPTKANPCRTPDPNRCGGRACTAEEYCSSDMCVPKPLKGCTDSRQCPNPNDPNGNLPTQIICNTAANGGNGQCQPCDMFTDEKCGDKLDPAQKVCVRMGMNKGLCKQCVTSASCDADQVCDPDNNSCRACKADSECASGICQDAKCVPATDPLYVDRSQVYCDMAMDGTGTKDKPYCQIQTAVMNRGAKALIVVRPSPAMKNYQTVTASSGTFSIRGPWADPGLAGKDWDTLMEATVERVRADGTADVTFDGIKVVSDGTQVAALCNSPMASITIHRSVIEGGKPGVRSDQCKQLILEHTQVRGAVSGGVRVSSDTIGYRIVNSLVTGNIGGPGVVLGANTSGVFEFNTMTQNGMMVTDGGGIFCEAPGLPKMLANSIVVGNQMAIVNGTQIVIGTNGPCSLSNIVVGTADMTTAPGTIKQQPDFVTGTSKLKAPSACCIDKAEKVATSPTDDYYGNPRPASGRTKLTLGFHEP